jgi:CxxC motif-containing protein (DUF1111 family)
VTGMFIQFLAGIAHWHSRALAGMLLVIATPAFASHTNCIALAPEPGEELSGGETTVFDTSPKAFGFPAKNLLEEHRAAFFVGHSFFNENWVVAPGSTAGRDGLGPLFNARSCSGCHLRDGRSRPPNVGEPMISMLMRISVPGAGPHKEPLPDPNYGDQIQGQAIPGVPPEADVQVEYEERAGQFADGEKFSLRKPHYSLKNLGYGPLSKDVMMSPRVAPAMIGLGLLEAVPEETLHGFADEQKREGRGICGRPNFVWRNSPAFFNKRLARSSGISALPLLSSRRKTTLRHNCSAPSSLQAGIPKSATKSSTMW